MWIQMSKDPQISRVGQKSLVQNQIKMKGITGQGDIQTGTFSSM
ncbi:hypothetical protein QUF95_02910 [Paenibacillus silvae]|nr:hypothetical protein [Paenibacillus silvae]